MKYTETPNNVYKRHLLCVQTMQKHNTLLTDTAACLLNNLERKDIVHRKRQKRTELQIPTHL